jgi:D-alanyl-D-alanine dipeptidase
MKFVSFPIVLIILLACGASFPNFQHRAIARKTGDSGPDRDGLDNLIRDLQQPADAATDDTETPSQRTETYRPGEVAHPPFSTVAIPTARATWQLTDRQCNNILKKAGVQTHPPKFPTPFVKTPLLLDSPIEGVVINSKWPDKNKRRVMDCRLIVSLIQLARRARAKGVVKIEYYSTWRPMTPAQNCKKGPRGRNCRRAFERAQSGHLPSQHSRATAIDIRWFTFEDGSTVDVETDYEKHFHHSPCDDHPRTEKGQFLQDFVCNLHRDQVFNVMLTPNADRDHYNHLHFDITPDAAWYILR